MSQEKGRKRYKRQASEVIILTATPRKKRSIMDTPTRVRIIQDINDYQGKIPQQTIFDAHGVSRTTGYRILASKEPRSTSHLSKRGRKRKIEDTDLDTIEAYENATFELGTRSYERIAHAVGLKEVSGRTIQRRMAERGVETYTAAQRIEIKPATKKARLERLSQEEATTEAF
jgi:hypothetical protein